MRFLENFEEFLDSGVVRKRSADKLRAESLISDARRRRKFVDDVFEKVGLKKENANYFIENVYDILIELIRARMLMEGFQASGKGAHKAEVSFMRKLNFSEQETGFMNDLRHFRNGILYYGEEFGADYAEKVLTFLDKIFSKLIKN